MTELLKRCALCETPYEPGEEACSKCFSPLSLTLLEQNPVGVFARQRTSRVVRVTTVCVYLGVDFAVRLAQQPALHGHGLTRGRGDLLLVLPVLIFLLAGLATYGLPGRTFHHYPLPAYIRRGTPRWWKGLAAAATFIAVMMVYQEMIMRPGLVRRGAQSSDFAHSEIAAAIDTANVIAYAGVGVVLAWNALAPLLGRQNMQSVQRRRLMEAQETRARASMHRGT